MKRTAVTQAPSSRRCAIYTRKSVARGLEQEFNSLDAQYEACRGYIDRQTGWTLVNTRYDDGGFTGANMDRPAFQRLLADVDAGLVDIIVVYKVDRLSRSLLDFASFMQRISTAGASFVAVTQNFSTADAMGRLTLNMLMSFAEFERSMISERTRDKIHAARRRGKWTGGTAPLGYSFKEKRLAIDEGEALVVREAFRLLLEHQHLSEVVKQLNGEGKLPRGSRLPNGRSPRWTNDALGRMLRNPIYVGKVTAGDELFPGEHAPLVDDATFEQVQAILADAARSRTVHGINSEYILRGLVQCGLCGSAMTPASTRHDDEEFRYYVCSRRNKAGKEACPAVSLPANAIEDYVIERVSEVAGDGTFVAAMQEALDRRIADRRAAIDTLCRTIPGRIANISAKTSKLTDELLRAEGPVRPAIEAKLRVESEQMAEAERQLAQAQRDRAQLEVLTADAAWVAKSLADFSTVWRVLTLANRGRLLRALIDRIVVDEPSGKVEMHLIDFAAASDGREAA